MLAISIGIAAVIAIMAAGKGMEKFVLGQMDVWGADTLYIETKVPNNRSGGGSDFGAVGITITTLRDDDIKVLLDHPNIITAYGLVNGQETVSYEGQIAKILLSGKGWSTPQVEVMNMESGRFFTEDEENSLSAVAVLGAKAKEKLFGESEAVGATMYIRGKAFRVVGVQAPVGSAFFFDMDNVIILPTKTMQKRLLGIDYVQAISARMKDMGKVDETVADIYAGIRENHNIEDIARDDFVVHTTVEAAETLTTVTGGITLLLVALVCISLIVGGVGIMNIMYVSVAERTFEIGLRKALGAKKKDILWQFLSEAVLITVCGGIIGIIFGALIAYLVYVIAIASNFKWVYSVSFFSIILSFGFSALIGIFFGLYPARQAANLDPIEALRKE